MTETLIYLKTFRNITAFVLLCVFRPSSNLLICFTYILVYLSYDYSGTSIRLPSFGIMLIHRYWLQVPVTKIQGHHMLATQFTMPTYCEVCNKMMFWNIRDRGCQCEYCNLSCHKKCAPLVNNPCPNQPKEVRQFNATLAVSSFTLSLI